MLCAIPNTTCRAQQERLASLEQEQWQVVDNLEQVNVMVDRAKSKQRNAQTNLSKLQRNELSLKQVNYIYICVCKIKSC